MSDKILKEAFDKLKAIEEDDEKTWASTEKDGSELKKDDEEPWASKKDGDDEALFNDLKMLYQNSDNAYTISYGMRQLVKQYHKTGTELVKALTSQVKQSEWVTSDMFWLKNLLKGERGTYPELIETGGDDLHTSTIDFLDDMLAGLDKNDQYGEKGDMLRYALTRLQQRD